MQQPIEYVNNNSYSKIIETSEQAKERIKKHKKTNTLFTLILFFATLGFGLFILLSLFKLPKTDFVYKITIATLSYVLVLMFCSFYWIYYCKIIQVKKKYVQFYSNKQAIAELRLEKHQSKHKHQQIKKQTRLAINQAKLEKQEMKNENNKTNQQINFAKKQDRLEEKKQSRVIKEQNRLHKQELNDSIQITQHNSRLKKDLLLHQQNLDYERTKLQMDLKNDLKNEEILDQIRKARTKFEQQIYATSSNKTEKQFVQQLSNLDNESFFKILGISLTSSVERIEQAYRMIVFKKMMLNEQEINFSNNQEIKIYDLPFNSTHNEVLELPLKTNDFKESEVETNQVKPEYESVEQEINNDFVKETKNSDYQQNKQQNLIDSNNQFKLPFKKTKRQTIK
ncbi:hypothetical protein [Mycoplasma capricolum]|uniref:Transmembrane protein n=1 Tax=Mycoplasma capricolum subsp. capricolum 14232 TaxID=1188238 RepID=A0A084EJ58_MYCCA|nr:hypothetical protein [Mycoplasma capricolum]KEZ18000.1 Hypothetical protein, predicted transmembrane protein [Mycoplasma capricolum subsp. capricolum 14232]